MEKYNQIQYVIGKDDLKEIINEIIDERFAEKKQDELISIKKVMEMLGVTDATLWRWDKMGILKKVRIGNRDGTSAFSIPASCGSISAG